jgi:hypothetical protein
MTAADAHTMDELLITGRNNSGQKAHRTPF